MVRTELLAPDKDRSFYHLRQRFAVWSIAIASSLTSSGLVSLSPSSAWAQEDPSGEKEAAKTDSGKPSDAKASNSDEDVVEQVEDVAFDRAAVNSLMQQNKIDEAIELIDSALKRQPNDAAANSMNLLVSRMLLSKEPVAAMKRLTAIVDRGLESESLDASMASAMAMASNYVAQSKEMAAEARLNLMDRVLEKLQNADVDLTASIKTARSAKGRMLIAEGMAEKAKSMFDQIVAEAMGSVDTKSSETVSDFVSAASEYATMLGEEYPEVSKEYLQKAEEAAMQLLDQAEAKAEHFAPMMALKSSRISNLLYTNPREADELLTGIEKKLGELADKLDESESKLLSTFEKSLSGLRSRLEPALKRELLIGSAAPEIDAEYFVAMEPTTMADLKGKVVLIDFWAVWCGPCIATFPHLIEWHEQYSDKGLVILGATRFYGYEWNEETKRAARGTDVSEEAELAMLEKFRESYDLHHGFFVSPKDSTYSRDFQVTGIPQAVLIDREGKIQMVRVGSGEANAKALHAKIEELLAN